MRIESSITSLSWIPSEAVRGSMKLPFEVGVAHYDEPPPEAIEDLDELRRTDRFRFANQLQGWIDVQDGQIVAFGQSGQGHIGSTTLKLGKKATTVAAVPLPDLRPEPEVGDGWVRFRQTAGGRTGLPTPRRVRRAPFVQISAPLAWSTLELTMHADGSSEGKLVGASPFPRHWVYGDDGNLVAKTGLIAFKDWYRKAFGKHSPWGDRDSEALVTEVESALERMMSTTIIRGGAKPKVTKLKKGKTLVEQGEPGDSLFLLLDGVLRVEVNGERIAELGPGALMGERAVLEGGKRTSTLRAVTDCRVAIATTDDLDREALAAISTGHRREDK